MTDHRDEDEPPVHRTKTDTSWTAYLKAFLLHNNKDTKNTELGLESSTGSCTSADSELSSVSSKESAIGNNRALQANTEPSTESEPVPGLEPCTSCASTDSESSDDRDLNPDSVHIIESAYHERRRYSWRPEGSCISTQVSMLEKKIERQEGMLVKQNARIEELVRLNAVNDLKIQDHEWRNQHQKWKIEDLEGQIHLLEKHLLKIAAIKGAVDALVDDHHLCK